MGHHLDHLFPVLLGGCGKFLAERLEKDDRFFEEVFKCHLLGVVTLFEKAQEPLVFLFDHALTLSTNYLIFKGFFKLLIMRNL